MTRLPRPAPQDRASVSGSRSRRAELLARRVALGGEPQGEPAGLGLALAAALAGGARQDEQDERGDHPELAVGVAGLVDEPEAEHERQRGPRGDEDDREPRQPEEQRDAARSLLLLREDAERSGYHRPAEEQERTRDVQRKQPLQRAHGGSVRSSDGWIRATGISSC